MKVLHVAMSKELGPGITRQMLYEQQAALACDLSWVVRIYVPDSYKHRDGLASVDFDAAASVMVSEAGLPSSWMAFRKGFYRWLLSQEAEFDVMLLRYSSYDPFQYKFLRQVAKPVFLVHHTLEVPELALERGLLRRFKAPCEAITGRFALRHAAGQIGVTKEVLDYECARAGTRSDTGFVYPNGFQCDENLVAEDLRGNIPRILFVASEFRPWHGLDCFLKSAVSCGAQFHVDVVGNVGADDRAHAKQDPRVRFHGRLPTDEIRALVERADVGLSSFALFRNGMEEACTLKVREYLAMGLPVYAGHRDIFPTTFPYFKCGACDIRAILTYAEDMRSTSRRTVANAVTPYIDKVGLLKSLYNWLSMRLTSTTF